jgi:potassium voltage-gated channel Eag-related subfamily H protein 8
VLPITENEAELFIKKFKGKFSAGYDEIPEYVVKQCAKLVKGPLAHICNILINSGTFPEKSKIARVKPLYKKGDIYSIQNYRPVSILLIFSKILERLMHSRLIIFLNKYSIITEVQNGFREQKSTITAIYSFIERIQEALDNGLQAIGIFFYLTKAYDVLNHQVLLDKLYTYGVRGNINSWCKSYLTDRKQFVEIN